MTELGYNQVLVIIDHFTKLAEAVPCQTASFKEGAEELGLDQESGEWLSNEKDCEEASLSEDSQEWDEDSVASEDEQDSLFTILAEEKKKKSGQGKAD